jgi:hypothetical protein
MPSLSPSDQRAPASSWHWWDVLALIVIVLATWLPRGLALDQFVTPDEPLWLNRSANFYYALGQRDFASTYQREHPGVTIMWAGTLGFLSRYPEYRGSGLGQIDPAQFHYHMKNLARVPLIELLAAGRTFMVLGHTLALALAYLYARRLIGPLPALIAFLLIAFDPFHLALTRLLHLDGMLGNLMLLSLLAFLSFLQERKAIALLLSAAAAGFSVLTKSPGVLIAPVIGLMALLDLWQTRSRDKEAPLAKQLWHSAWPLIAWVAVGAGVMFVFWPAMWGDPTELLLTVFKKAGKWAESGHYSAVFFNGRIAESGDLGPAYFYFYPLTYLWRSTPVELIGLVAALFGLFTWRKPFDQRPLRFTSIALFLLVVLFTIGMTIGSKKFDRYLVPVYAPLDLLAALGWVFVAVWLKEKSLRSRLKYSPYLLLAIVVGVQMAGSLGTFPYYFSYYNPLMGGSRKAPEVMQIGWGEGLDQAARYLNQKPDAAEMGVVSWYNLGPFSYFFNGKAPFMSYLSEVTPQEWEKFLANNYAVVYVHQWQRGISGQVLEYLFQRTPEKTIWINGIEYVRIYALH